MYRLYEHLNNRGTVPTADEIAMAKGEANFDITAVDAHLARLEQESNTLLKAFTKQSLKHNVRLYSFCS
jgi:cytochrome c556